MAKKPTYEELEQRVKELENQLSDHKRAEEELDRLAREWQATFDATDSAIFVLDKDMRILRANRQAEKLFQRSSGEMIGEPCWRIVHGMEHPIPECPVFGARHSLGRETMDLQIDDGWFHVTVDPILDKNGGYIGVVHIMTDITELRLSTEKLQASEEKFRFLAEKMADIVWTSDSDLKPTYVSPSIEKVLGFTPEERKGQALEETLTPESLDRALSIFMEELKRDEYDNTDPDRSRTIEFECYRKDGSTVWMENNMKFIRNSVGAMDGVYGVSRDITQRKQAEAVLRQSHVELERMVEERTTELVKANRQLHLEIAERKQTEDKLNQAKNVAEAANIAKSDFLANMSHELRTPLNHIIGFTELVLDRHFGDLNETQEEYLGDVLTSSRHLLSLINDILDLSKVEAGKFELELTDVNLKEVLANSLVMIKEKAMKNGIQLSTDVYGIPEAITADERKLKQIIYNLLSNAVKFTPNGGEICLMSKKISRDDLKMMHLELSETQNLKFETGDFIKISVIDTGIGIKPEELKRIFSPFEQVENSASREFQGTGLGLSLSRSLVELHGGRIWAESEGEGKGSRFSFILPVKNIANP